MSDDNIVYLKPKLDFKALAKFIEEYCLEERKVIKKPITEKDFSYGSGEQAPGTT